MLTVDHRERALSAVLGLEHTLMALPVGDVVCRYDDGSAWVAERKTASDLARSIIDGRWADQLSRLHAAGFRDIFVLVEGDLSDTSLSYNALLGACVNVELRKNSHLIRSCDVQETAAFLRHLVQKCDGAPPGVPSGVRPPALDRGQSKMKRNAEKEHVWIRQLMCVPSISERIARKLLEHFGDLPALQQALADLQTFPSIRLSDKSCIGEARLTHLANYLTEQPAAPGGGA